MADIEEEFDLDAAHAEQTADLVPFGFRWKGVRWEFPPIADADWRIISLADQLNSLQDTEQESELDPTAVAALEKLFRLAVPAERADEWEKTQQPISAMILLFQRWMQHSGQTPGEMLGSDGSSPSTAEPSPQTSRATTRSGSAKPSSGAGKPKVRHRNSAAVKAAVQQVNSSG